MSRIIGIDLGTTNSLVGAVESGFPILYADSEGRRLTPSAVHYPRVGQPVVGMPALRGAASAPDRTVVSIKRLMGLDRIPAELAQSWPVVETPEGLRVRFGEFSLAPEEISAAILGKLRADAEKALGEEVRRAVITVPAYFNDAQRAATKRAGELAGLTVERILNEPTAAALAYGIDKTPGIQRVAVYDLGGGTFDITILNIEDGVFHVLSTCGNTALGGDDIDRAIVAWVVQKSNLPEMLASDPSNRVRLHEAVRAAKEKLSEAGETSIQLVFAGGHPPLDVVLDRDTLEKIAFPIVAATKANCTRALADASLMASELNRVILVGGATRMPLVRRLVAEWFGCEPDTSQHPDEAVALGAVLQAGVLEGSITGMLLLDVTPLSLGIETFGGLMNVIIPRNTTIPARGGEMFTNAVAGQSSLLVHVLQGERELAADNWSLGKFEIPFQTDTRGSGKAGVQFEIDANGLLTVLARDVNTGVEKTVTIQRAIDIDDEKVTEMIDQSVEHAFEDMAERRWIEASNKARELLTATKAALAAAGDRVSSAEIQTIQNLADAVGDALLSREPGRLLSAMEALDQGTEDLAIRVLEALMA